ncbi:hypothetical protein Pfo_011591, partial [Paulownia fortunei]
MGIVEEALQVFGDMILGKFCAPDEVTFTTIIHGLLNRMKLCKFLIIRPVARQIYKSRIREINYLC